MSSVRTSKTANAPYTLKELDKVAEIASFFGFTPIKTPDITRDDILKASLFKSAEKSDRGERIEKTERPERDEDHIRPQPEEKIALLRSYLQYEMHTLPHPLMLYYKKPFARPGEKKKSGTYQCGMDIIGTANSVAEALTIKTLLAILSEHKFDSMFVEINTVGDKDSMARFDREISSYVRKHLVDFPADLRPIFKKEPHELLRSRDERCKEWRDNCPKPMSFLSEPSIQHFKEVLEYLETLDIPYRINEYLIGDRAHTSHTIFEIYGNHYAKKDSEPSLLASGSRHNYLSKKIGFKKDVPIMSATVCFKKAPEVGYRVTVKKILRPKFYFVQLGFRARLKSLAIIDTLRKARIPVYHSLTKDKLGNQLNSAENLKLSHLIIMGQKEAIEDTVVIRHMETRVQDTVSLADLSSYLQKLR